MSKLRVAFSLFVTAILLSSQLAQAAVVEVDVTVKSVDVKARGITVTYETKLGQKAIDLDVSRKADIIVNGKPGTLDAVKSGQKAKVSYEKELGVVTKIDATGKGTDPGKEVYRLTLQLSEFGDGKFRIEKTSEPPKDDFKGTPFKLSRWPHTKATKGQDGMFRLIHDLSDPDDLDVLAMSSPLEPLNTTLERNLHGLVLSNGPLPDRFGRNSRGAFFGYARSLWLPITVICDLSGYEDGDFDLNVTDSFQQLGFVDCIISLHTQDQESRFDFISIL